MTDKPPQPNLPLQVGRLLKPGLRPWQVNPPQPEPDFWVNLNKQGDATRIVRRKDGWCKTPVYLHPPKPQPEPVAWVWKYKESGSTGVYWQHPSTYGIDMDNPLYEWTLLSASPLHRKPLTDAEIDSVTKAQWGEGLQGVMFQAHRAYARAIEAVINSR
jgi:hypothetical protein